MQKNIISSAAKERERQLVLTPSQFEMRQASMKRNLYVTMHQNSDSENTDTDPFLEDKTRWLPGPLSYPWVLILLGIPHILNLLSL